MGGSAVLSAQEQGEPSAASEERVDAILLLDASGSMRLTDPKKLRNEGARLFVQFLKPGDRLAIVAFAEDAKVVRPLGPISENTAVEVQQTLDAVGDGGQYTDILAGVKLARSILEGSSSKSTPVIVLLSDGKLEPMPERGTREALTEELLNQVLPELKSDGIRIHTLAFSPEADKELLEEIALATEGSKAVTPDAETIHKSYADLFLAVKKPQVLPLTRRGFRIDSGIQEATFYINREAGGEVTLRPPEGEPMTEANHPADIKWFRGEGFDVVTVFNPTPGDWQLTGLANSDGFATVLTNLKLITEWPGTIQVASKVVLQARLFENEKPVALPEMSGATKFAFEITPTDKISEPILREFLVDDGTHGDRVAGDGTFSYAINLKEVGEYRLKVLARAPTFERSQQIPFRVRPPLVSLVIERASEGGDHEQDAPHHGETAGHGHEEGAASGESHGHEAPHDSEDPAASEGHDKEGEASTASKNESDQFQTMAVILSPEAQAFKQLDVKLFAVDSERRKFAIPIDAEGHGRFSAPISRLPSEGVYEVQATITGEGKKKDKVKFDTAMVKVERTAAHSGGPVVIMVEEEKVAPSVVPALLIAILLQGGAAGGLVFVLRRSITGPKIELPSFEVPPVAYEALEALEAKAAVVELNFDDPALLSTDPVPMPEGFVASEQATTAVSPDAAVPAEADSSAPSEESAPPPPEAPPEPPAEEPVPEENP